MVINTASNSANAAQAQQPADGGATGAQPEGKFDLNINVNDFFEMLDLDPTSWSSWLELGVETIRDKLTEMFVESWFSSVAEMDELFLQIKKAASHDEVVEM